MPEVIDLKLSIDTIPANDRIRGMFPIGRITRASIDGSYSCQSYRFNSGNVEVALPMDAHLALNVLSSFARHQSHRRKADEANHRDRCGNNHLTFLAESQDWPITEAEQHPDGRGPVLNRTGFTAVQNIYYLTPNKPHVLIGSDGRVVHGFLSTFAPNRVIEVRGSTSHGNAPMMLNAASIAIGEFASSRPSLVELDGQYYYATDHSDVEVC